VIADYSRVRNKHTPRLINFLTFFQGLQPYSGLHRAYFSSISVRYKWGYACSFCQIFQGLCLFKGVRLFQIADYTRTPTVAAQCTVGYFVSINFDFKDKAPIVLHNAMVGFINTFWSSLSSSSSILE
jgi:hypothetical protein